MKKNFKMLICVLCYAMTTAVFTACTANDDNPVLPDNPVIPDNPTAQADYAILFYGYGGSTLDAPIMDNLRDFYGGKAESYNQVKIAAQYKFSPIDSIKTYWIDEILNYGMITQEMADEYYKEFSAMELETIRFIVDPTVEEPDNHVLLNENSIYGQKNCDIASVDSLTNFINWATKACPAKHYVLILSDHGGGYMPHDDPTYDAARSRGVIYDNVPNKNAMHFTASSLKYALERADAHMDVIYMDACLMNNIEYQFELKDVADYLILSTFSVPGSGGSYDVLIDELANNDLETALSNYNKKVVEKWDQEAAENYAEGYLDAKWDYHDMTVTRTRNLDAFGENFRVFVDKLVAAYADEGNKAIIDTITKYTFKINNARPSYDLVDYVETITMSLPEVFDEAFYYELGTSFNNCLVSQYCSDFLMKKGLSVDCSILLTVKGNYYIYVYDIEDPLKLNSYQICYADGRKEKYEPGKTDPIETGSWKSTLADTYEKLAFDKATGWSRWLYLNEQLPCVVSPVEMHYPLDD